MSMKISDKGKALIIAAEGIELKPYLCPAGKWTIGVGALIDPNGRAVTKNTPTITEAQAYTMLERDCENAENAVTQLVGHPLTQNQFDALVSFVFNMGRGNFYSSTLLKKVRADDVKGSAAEFDKWVYATNPKTGKKEVLPGLVTRRAAERKLFEGDA